MNLFFDLDGTLTDSREGILASMRFALDRLGAPSPSDDELASYIGPPLRGTFSTLLNTKDPERLEEAVSIYRERFGTIGLFENRVYDGIMDILDHFTKQGSTLCVVTAKPTVYAKRIVERFQLAPFFIDVVGSELNGDRTDKAELIQLALTTHQLDRHNTLMIGDRENDIRGATKLAMASLGVLWGFGSRHELTQAGATYLAETPEDLLESVANWQHQVT